MKLGIAGQKPSEPEVNLFLSRDGDGKISVHDQQGHKIVTFYVVESGVHSSRVAMIRETSLPKNLYKTDNSGQITF